MTPQERYIKILEQQAANALLTNLRLQTDLETAMAQIKALAPPKPEQAPAG